MRVPDPNQEWLPDFSAPVDGPPRFIEVAGETGMTFKSWIARKRHERLAAQELQRVELPKRTHRKGQLCLACGDSFWPGSSKQARESGCGPCRAGVPV